jgi:hypothetical protein
LSQIAAGQAEEAPNVIDYSDVTAEEAGMAGRSTRTDRVPDTGNLDPGYHYAAYLVSARGDCDGDGRISIDELIFAVRVALAWESLSACTNLDADFDGGVTIDELVAAVGDAMAGSG